MKALVIDDEAGMRAIIATVLADAGYTVAEASDGRIAMEMMEADPADLVITDIIMPNQEGVETIRLLRGKYPHVQIVAVSGGGRTSNFDFLHIARQFGAAATLEKPFRKQQLLDVIRGLPDTRIPS